MNAGNQPPQGRPTGGRGFSPIRPQSCTGVHLTRQPNRIFLGETPDGPRNRFHRKSRPLPSRFWSWTHPVPEMEQGRLDGTRPGSHGIPASFVTERHHEN